MSRRLGSAARLCFILVIGAATTTSAQVNPSNMRSGCTSIASGVGLLTTAPMFSVPTGNSFVLTDLSISPTGVAAPPAPSPAAWRIACWLANYSDGSPRWVSGAYGDYNAPNPTWPVQMNWTTGLVFPQNEGIQFGVSAGGGQAFPAMTVCWSGYLVANSTTSVIPGNGAGGPALSAVPNPAAADLTLRFSLTRAQRVTIGVFSVEGRRVRTLHRGTLEAGSHEVAWDGRDDVGRMVADGLYFARLETPQGSRTTRIARTR